MRANKTDQSAEQVAGVRGRRGGGGGRGVFEAMLLGQLPALMGRARSFESSEAAAQDLVQDTLERALVHSDRFVLGTCLSGWLMQIMRNLFIDRYRARPRVTGIEALDWLPVSAQDPESVQPWQLVSLAEMLEALEDIDEPLRRTFVLACLSGWSYRRVSVRLGVPVATVGTRILRVRGHLRARLLARLCERDGEWRRLPAPAAPHGREAATVKVEATLTARWGRRRAAETGSAGLSAP
jgi:RNA polymerase sigma-70 factor (ECF subfamily)